MHGRRAELAQAGVVFPPVVLQGFEQCLAPRRVEPAPGHQHPRRMDAFLDFAGHTGMHARHRVELDAQRRELFARRYGEERQRIEEQIRREMDEKRRPLLKEVIAKLKAEFAPVAVPGRPSGVPAPPVP